METISHQRFRARTEYILQHLQVVDVAMTKLFGITSRAHGQGLTILQALSVTSGRYDRLNHPADHDARIFNYSRARNVEHSIVTLYGSFSEYMRSILGEMFDGSPLVVAGKAPGTLQFQEIIRLGSFDAIKEKIVDAVFRKIESERSTIKLLEKIIDHTGVHPDPNIQSTALMYLEMRHLFIHNHGKADAAFVAKYGASINVSQEGQSLPTRSRIAEAAVKAVVALVRDIDTQLIAVGCVTSR